MKKRLFFLIFISSFALLFFRLFDVQVLKGDSFLAEAEDNRLYTLKVAANRGVIFDRYDEPLSWNERVYFYRENLDTLYSQEKLLTQDEALEVLATDEARLDTDFARYYIPSESLSHTLGYVAEADKDAMSADSSLVSGQLLGRLGLEKIYERKLRGSYGSKTVEINAMAVPQRTLWSQASRAGEDVHTTLDPILSQVAWEALGEQKASFIINDAKTGEIIALVSKPGFDSNLMSQHRSLDEAAQKERQKQVSAWLQDPAQRYFHRAVSGAYPPGSVFKLITALAALESGGVDAGTTVVDEGVLKVGEYEYKSWLGRAEGEIGLVRAIARSNDIFFYKAAEWTGPDNIAAMARRFGFGTRTGIELTGEAAGLVPDPAWKEKTLGEPWYLGNTYHYGIGQGDILVTPLQVSQMLQALANNASMCTPHIVKEEQSLCHELGVADDQLDLVLDGMLAACSSGGTASVFFAQNDLHLLDNANSDAQIRNGAIACKTGTAEFGGEDEQGRRNTHAWWVGIVDIRDLEAKEADSLHSEKTKRDVLREEWISLVNEHGFPERITITVMAESDEEHPFKEGAIDAAKPAKEVIDWILGR